MITFTIVENTTAAADTAAAAVAIVFFVSKMIYLYNQKGITDDVFSDLFSFSGIGQAVILSTLGEFSQLLLFMLYRMYERKRGPDRAS